MNFCRLENLARIVPPGILQNGFIGYCAVRKRNPPNFLKESGPLDRNEEESGKPERKKIILSIKLDNLTG